jgi:hypothetical protein
MSKRILGVAAAMAIALAVPALAQQPKAPPAPVKIPEKTFFKGQQPTQYLARDLLLGAKVRGPEGRIIGDIEDLILSETNEVIGVIMGVGGFLGAGEKRIGVRLSALEIKTDGNATTVTLPGATKEVLKALEPYKRARPPKSLLDRAFDKAKEIADKTAETSADAYQKAKEQAGPALEKAKEAVKGAVEKAKDAAQPAEKKQ